MAVALAQLSAVDPDESTAEANRGLALLAGAGLLALSWAATVTVFGPTYFPEK
jgi:hypothetical protein